MIIEAASKRLAERCGRTGEFAYPHTTTLKIPRSRFAAMPEMLRTWVVPTIDTASALEIHLREPPMTGDGDTLGLKTWGTSYFAAKILESVGESFSSSVKDGGVFLELGSGTGLLGITAAALWGRHTVLTDLPEIMDNLLYNASKNKVVSGRPCSFSCDALDWNNPEGTQFSEKFDVSFIMIIPLSISIDITNNTF